MLRIRGAHGTGCIAAVLWGLVASSCTLDKVVRPTVEKVVDCRVDCIPTSYSNHQEVAWSAARGQIGWLHAPLLGFEQDSVWKRCDLELDDDRRGLWLMDAGGEHQRFIGRFFGREIDWSPDGRFLAYWDGAIKVVRVPGDRVDTTSIRTLAVGHRPHWSPDGSRIVYDVEAYDPVGTWTVSSTGESPPVHVHGDFGHPSWSPDGEWLVGMSRWGKLARMRPDGSGYELLGVTNAVIPRWSPDGTWIAFLKWVNPEERHRLWVVRPDGSEAHQVAASRVWPMQFAWSPDSGSIVFTHGGAKWEVSSTTGTLWIVDIATGVERPLTVNKCLDWYVPPGQGPGAPR